MSFPCGAVVQVLCLRRQLQLLLQRRAELSGAAESAAAALESLVQQQQQALHDVEVQLRLKQGQVRMVGCMAWPPKGSGLDPSVMHSTYHCSSGQIFC
jgi:hypothetical protein